MKAIMLSLLAFFSVLPYISAQETALVSPSSQQLNITTSSVLRSSSHDQYDWQLRTATSLIIAGGCFAGVGTLIALTFSQEGPNSDHFAAGLTSVLMIGGGAAYLIVGYLRYHRIKGKDYSPSRMSVYSDANHLGLAYIFRQY